MRAHNLAIVLLLCGCAATDQNAPIDALREDLRAELAAIHRGIETGSANAASQRGIEIAQQSLGAQVASVGEQVEALAGKLDRQCREVQARQQCNDTPQRVVVSDADKMLLGEIEKVWLAPPGLQMIARMDTGASSSSLHAGNITEFERDGEDWVRFEVTTNDVPTTVERPVTKHVRVYQQADKQGSRRPVVELRIHLGSVQDTFEFSLADRSHLQHDLILGRNFLTDIALVDVARQFVQQTRNDSN